MGPQRGDASVKMLTFLLVVAMAGAIASPYLLKSDRTEPETKAIDSLRIIITAQKDYFAGRRSFGNTEKLRTFGAFYEWRENDQDYKYTITVNGSAQRWCAEAVPAKPDENVTFGTDESGVIYQDLNASPCNGGVLDKTGGTPLR